MSRRGLVFITALWWGSAVFAQATQYEIQVDGMTRPLRAFGIERLLKKIDGVETVEIDLDRAIVFVDMAPGKTLTEPQLRELCNDAGFTFRAMKTRAP